MALNIPGAAHKSPSAWSKIFGGNPKVTVKETKQTGHRLAPYNDAGKKLSAGGCSAEHQSCP